MTERASRMEVRSAVPGDAGVIASLSELLGYPTSEEEVRDRLQGLDPGGNVVLVLTDGPEVVGWVHLFLSNRLEEDSFAELGGLILDPGYRGRGLGRRLLGEAERWAAGNGCRKIRVRSHEKRIEGHRFYERVGYRRVKRQQVFDKDLRR